MVDLACRPAQLAAELTRRGADAVVVGGTARWLCSGLLRSGPLRPRDLDLVVEPTAVEALVSSLAELQVPARVAPVLRCRDVRFETAWGPLDVFVDARPAARPVLVEGVPVAVLVPA